MGLAIARGWPECGYGGPPHDWHVLFTRYCQRILQGHVRCFSTEEEVRARIMDKAWEVNSRSLSRQTAGKK